MSERFSKDLVVQIVGGVVVALIGYLASQMFSGGSSPTSEPSTAGVPSSTNDSSSASNEAQRRLEAKLQETKRLADELEKQKRADDQRRLDEQRRQAALDAERQRASNAAEQQRQQTLRDQQAFREEIRQRESQNAQRAATDCNDPNYNVYLDPGNCNKETDFDKRWSNR